MTEYYGSAKEEIKGSGKKRESKEIWKNRNRKQNT